MKRKKRKSTKTQPVVRVKVSGNKEAVEATVDLANTIAEIMDVPKPVVVAENIIENEPMIAEAMNEPKPITCPACNGKKYIVHQGMEFPCPKCRVRGIKGG